MKNANGNELKADGVRFSRTSTWLCTALIAPMSLAVRVPVDSIATSATPNSSDVDTRTTKFTLAGGGGRFYREYRLGGECAANDPTTFHEEFGDVGAEIDYQHGDKGHFGIRGGYVHETAELVADPGLTGELGSSRGIDTYYANPFISHEGDKFGLGAGVLITSRPLNTADQEDSPFKEDVAIYPSAHLRFSRSSNQLYLSAHLWEGVPIYSGGGMVMMGLGGRPFSWLDLYGGYASEGPFAVEGFLARATFDLNREWSLMTTVRFPTDFSNEVGTYEDQEGTVSLGVQYRLISTK